tara:strand:+ start:5017 stop:5754 length:738 start_codon:yes stop_codon:yes gene_type:complete
MRTVYLFDVDGTLTPPKQKAVEIFRRQFFEWVKDKEVYLVSGGSFKRLNEQLTPKVMDRIEGVFACMGNVYYRRKKDEARAWFHEYEHKFELTEYLKKSLDAAVAESKYPTKTGKHYEARTGMVNFSIVGRNATQQERNEYAAYDAEHREREHIVEKLQLDFSKLDFVIGGAVSIDIFNKGRDKSQVIREHFKDLPEDAIIHFVGDRTEYPGNDFAIAEAVSKRKNGHVHSVESWKDTAELLKSI